MSDRNDERDENAPVRESGPEGGYGDSSGEGNPAVRAIGEGDPEALARQAQKLGAPKARGGAAADARNRHEKG